MMIKKLVMMFAFGLLIFGLAACSGDESVGNDVTEQAENTVKENEGGFLWKVEANGNIVYMLGSIHVATDDFYPLNSEMEAAFAESDFLAVEADILNVDQAEVEQFINENGTYGDGTTLADHVPEQLYYDVTDELENFGVEMDMVEVYKPWYVYMILDNFRVMSMGFDPMLGIDYHFLNNAGEKEIIELEGMDFQLNLFNNFSDAVQQMLLKSSVGDIEKAKEEMNNMMTSWKEGDFNTFEEVILNSGDDSEEYKIFMTELMDKRNVGMVEKIEGFLNGEEIATYFVIVGAGHYVGEQGIVQLLENKEYTVERLIQ